MSSGSVNDFSQVLSERLRTLRGNQPKAAFARKLGISNPSTYHNYEAGRVPDVKILERIASLHGVAVDWLLGRENVAMRRDASKRPMDYEKVMRLMIHTAPQAQLLDWQKEVLGRDAFSDADRLGTLQMINDELARRANAADLRR